VVALPDRNFNSTPIDIYLGDRVPDESTFRTPVRIAQAFVCPWSGPTTETSFLPLAPIATKQYH
jgi:hypothetical protein